MQISNLFLFILEIHVLSESLVSSALKRLHSGFRPATAVQYNRMFRDFLCFLETVQIATCQVNTVVHLSYMEYLHQKGLSHSTFPSDPPMSIRNYMGLKYFLLIFNTSLQHVIQVKHGNEFHKPCHLTHSNRKFNPLSNESYETPSTSGQ